MAEENAKEEKSASDAKRILLVDDDAEIIEAMSYTLEAKGYKILVARDGNQGLAMAEREDPDLVILDMMMPKRSGFLVLEKLRRTRPVPMRESVASRNCKPAPAAGCTSTTLYAMRRTGFVMKTCWPTSARGFGGAGATVIVSAVRSTAVIAPRNSAAPKPYPDANLYFIKPLGFHMSLGNRKDARRKI